jgi:putative RNA 2'-phosphotransferase
MKKVKTMENYEIQLSKFLSYLLRHEPQAIGLDLDEEGWGSIQELVDKANQHGHPINRDQILQVVKNNDKQRFSISSDGLKIRAVQGHSNPAVHIHYVPKIPPESLFHGTADRFLESIRNKDLISGERQYVHLSANRQTAEKVGKRHGKSVVLQIKSQEMQKCGLSFFQAENGVWLTKSVPIEYIIFE